MTIEELEAEITRQGYVISLHIQLISKLIDIIGEAVDGNAHARMEQSWNGFVDALGQVAETDDDKLHEIDGQQTGVRH